MDVSVTGRQDNLKGHRKEVEDFRQRAGGKERLYRDSLVNRKWGRQGWKGPRKESGEGKRGKGEQIGMQKEGRGREKAGKGKETGKKTGKSAKMALKNSHNTKPLEIRSQKRRREGRRVDGGRGEKGMDAVVEEMGL